MTFWLRRPIPRPPVHEAVSAGKSQNVILVTFDCAKQTFWGSERWPLRAWLLIEFPEPRLRVFLD